MMDRELRKKILDGIKPTSEEHEELEKVVKRFRIKLKRASNRLDIKCDFFTGGSFGKGTYLRGSSDVDIFCRFDQVYHDVQLSKYLEKILV